MRRGCISQGNIQCDNCGQVVPYAGRYMTVEEKDGEETSEAGETKNYCVKCCVEKKYAAYREEKRGKSINLLLRREETSQRIELFGRVKNHERENLSLCCMALC